MVTAAWAGFSTDAPAATQARAKALHVTASPSLVTRFRKQAPDYVVRCKPGKRVRLKLAAPRGMHVSVDARRYRRGTFKASVMLAPGQRFTIVAKRRGHGKRYSIRCLPADFPAFKAKRTGRPQAPGYVVTPTQSFNGNSSPYVAIFDSFGVPVWWFDTHGIVTNASLLPNGHLLWA